jgi:hypothetical protein
MNTNLTTLENAINFFPLKIDYWLIIKVNMAQEGKLTIAEYNALYPMTHGATNRLDAAIAAVGVNYPNSIHAKAYIKALRVECNVIEFSSETDAFKSADVEALIARCKGLEDYLDEQVKLHTPPDANKYICLKSVAGGIDHIGACILDAKEGIMLTHAANGPLYAKLTCKNIRMPGQTCTETVAALVKLMKLKPCDVHPKLFTQWGYEVIENPNI